MKNCSESSSIYIIRGILFTSSKSLTTKTYQYISLICNVYIFISPAAKKRSNENSTTVYEIHSATRRARNARVPSYRRDIPKIQSSPAIKRQKTSHLAPTYIHAHVSRTTRTYVPIRVQHSSERVIAQLRVRAHINRHARRGQEKSRAYQIGGKLQPTARGEPNRKAIPRLGRISSALRRNQVPPVPSRGRNYPRSQPPPAAANL